MGRQCTDKKEIKINKTKFGRVSVECLPITNAYGMIARVGYRLDVEHAEYRRSHTPDKIICNYLNV